jgi:uncharacterized protein (TIGR02246 family)
VNAVAVLDDVQARWNRAGLRWDPAALAAIYTDDALFHGGRPDHCAGRAAIRRYFDSYRGVIESARLELVDQHVVALAPDTVLAQGWGDFAFVLAGQRETVSRLRTTMVLVKRDGWLILAQHFSPPPATPPLGEPTLKAMP